MRLIDANDLISDMKDNCCGECDLCVYSRYEGDINVRYFCGLIEEAETVERPHGKWVHREDMNYLDENKVTHIHFMCEKCGFIHDFIDGHTSQYNFCPNCGEEMEADNDKVD